MLNGKNWIFIIGVIGIVLISGPVMGKKKDAISLPGVKTIAILPFQYFPQKDFTKDAGTLAANKLSETLEKKAPFAVIPRNDVDRVLTEQGVDLSKPISKELIQKLGQLLKADALLAGKMPIYNEKESERDIPDTEEDGGYYTENVREVHASFDLIFYSTATGEPLAEYHTEEKDYDTSKPPMEPPSAALLLERIAATVAKDIRKRVTN